MERRIRLAGVSCFVGGILWIILGSLSTLPRFAAGTTGFRLAEAVFVPTQIMLLIGVVGLAWSGAVGSGFFSTFALGVALLGRTIFVLAELHAFDLNSVETPLLPLGALLTAVGMLLVGGAVLRTGRWTGWRRMVPLLCGLYPFVVMFPFIFISNEPNVWAIVGWGTVWVLLGYAISSNTRQRQELEAAPLPLAQ